MFGALNAAETGMTAQSKQMEITSNNLANADTAAFKASRAEFQDLLYQTIKEPGSATSSTTQNPTGIQIGAGTKVIGTHREHAQGGLKQTERELDLAIEGDGFFAVQAGDGQVSYTRDGSFRLSNDRRLVTASGMPVIPEITVPEGVTSISISQDGRVQASVQSPTGVKLEEVGQLQVTNFASPAGLKSIGSNLYVSTGASGEATAVNPGDAGAGRLHQRYLESSNVNPITEMTNMVRTQRMFELNSKVIATSDQMLGTLGQVK